MPISTIDSTSISSGVTLTSPVLTTPNLGTPSALVLTNATSLTAAIQEQQELIKSLTDRITALESK